MTDLPEIFDLLSQVERELLDLPQQLLLAAHQIVTPAGLGSIDSNLGLVTAGEFRTGNGKAPGKGFSGVRIAFPAMTYNSVTWNVAGVNSDVLEFGLRASDGAALAGAGQIVLDHLGVTVANNSSRMRFTDSTGTLFSLIYVSSADIFYMDHLVLSKPFGMQVRDSSGNTGNASLGESAGGGAWAGRMDFKLTPFASGSNGAAFIISAVGSSGSFRVSTTAYTSGSETAFTFVPPAYTTMGASAEVLHFEIDLHHHTEHATGAITTQRSVRIVPTTHDFVGASTITTAATLAVEGPPIAGTNATITNNYAVWVQTGNTLLAGGLNVGTASGAGTGVIQSSGMAGDALALAIVMPTGAFRVSDVSASSAIHAHIRPNSGKDGYLSFTENSVADRWIIGIKGGDSKLYFRSGSPSSATDRASLTTGSVLNLANAAGALQVNGTQVVTARQTGWAAPTATLSRTAVAAADSLATTISHLAALVTDLTTHGLIGA